MICQGIHEMLEDDQRILHTENVFAANLMGPSLLDISDTSLYSKIVYVMNCLYHLIDFKENFNLN